MTKVKSAKTQGEMVRIRPEIAKLLQEVRARLDADPRYIWASRSTTEVAQMCLVKGMDLIHSLLDDEGHHPLLISRSVPGPSKRKGPDTTRKTKLAAWMKENGKTKKGFARELGVASKTLSRWYAGKATPSVAHLALIEQSTGDAVRASDFAKEAKEAKEGSPVERKKTEDKYFEECLADGIVFMVEHRADGSQFCYAHQHGITQRQSRLLRRAGFRYLWRTIGGKSVRVHTRPVEGGHGR